VLADEGRPLGPVDFRCDPARHRHRSVSTAGPVATVTLEVDPGGRLCDDYELKLNRTT
jgi:benzoyl-CoA-dihydrodiol lyase